MTLAFATLETDRLVLRPITHRDDEAFLRIFSNPETMKYWSREPLTSLEEAAKMVQEEIDWGQSGKCLNWGVALRGSDELIGKVNLFDYDAKHRRAEIGYAFDPRHWGKGLATEAMRPVLDHAFGVLRFHRVEADTDPGNLASIAVLEKFGFRREGYSRDRFLVHGAWQDSVVLGLLETDYREALRRDRD